MKKGIMLIANGFEEMEMINIVDVLRRGGVELLMVSTQEKMMQGAHGVKIEADKLLSEVKAGDYDFVVLPGGYDNSVSLSQNNAVLDILRDFKAKNKLTAAICAAPAALAAAGIIESKYTCYPGCEGMIESHIPAAKSDGSVVCVEGTVHTSKGPATAMTFGLHLLGVLEGMDAAQKVKEGLLA